jgi:hypothetical protein
MAVSSDVDKSLRENPAFRKYAFEQAQKRLGYPPRAREVEAEKARLVEELGTIITKPSLSPSEDNQLKSIFGEDYDFSFLRKEGARATTTPPKDALSRTDFLEGRRPSQPTSPVQPTGTEGQQGIAGTGSGSMESTGGGIRGFSRKQFRGMTPEQRRAVIARDDETAANVSKGMSGDVKSQLALPQTKKTALERARDILRGDTYQLGSSSILTAAREMRKPTPFKQRTEEQVAARNLVVRERMAREQGKTYDPKATALQKAKSRMRDVATAQKGAQQFFADTGVSPRQVRALSGERMPERRRTYEAPKEPPSLKSMIEEQRELDKKRRNR